ncbi:pancreatic secretory granule membrane major glycoprotein GP2-like [Salminus brasiliensis]|uniref:pancreatic secretory granule membrane major glycoprotein GP2-like n=1 Tax=Salminus brasiliensis TaxID=930266 RepID=UPI003B82DEBA
MTATSDAVADPCYNYVSLDQPWRANNESGNMISDINFSGWYRMLYHGMNIRLADSCVPTSRCGGYSTLWLNGPHPQIQDGVVTRQVCVNIGNGCCSHGSTYIQLKACPGNYYVYELVSVYGVYSTYCTDVNTTTPTDAPAMTPTGSGLNITSSKITPTAAFTGSLSNSTTTITTTTTTPTATSDAVADPCYNYVSLDQPWRANNESGNMISDINFSGWYRMLYHGMNIRLADSCVPTSRCGGYSTLWLNGPHPQIQDGVVTRQVCVNVGNGCCSHVYMASTAPTVQMSTPQLPLMHQHLPLITPTGSGLNITSSKITPTAAFTGSLSNSTTTITTTTTTPTATSDAVADPCYNYVSLDQPWRANNESGNMISDINFSGWYRMLYHGMNIRLADSCVPTSRCGGYSTLWLNGPHPQIQDGVVTRQVCVNVGNGCCSHGSTYIQVKACPGNYYVYELVSVYGVYSTYCTDVNTTTPTDAPAITPTGSGLNITSSKMTPTAAFTGSLSKSTTTITTTTTTPTARVDPCKELNCTVDEWCGEMDGVHGCFCNESRTRTDQESFDSREQCESSSGTMSLSRCQLFEAGFSADVLHLSDPNCTGTLRNGRLVFHFDNDDHICGTNLMANGTHFIYTNTIQGGADSAGGPIHRKKYLELNFSCIYQISQTLTMDTELHPLQSIIHKTLPDGQGMYQVRMIPYQDAGLSRPYNGNVSVVVDQRIYVGVFVQGVDSRQIATVIDSCWATPVNDPRHAVRWDLIVNRCPNPADKTVKVLQNGVSTTGRFSFKMFAFNGDDQKVFLHCSIHLCLLRGNNCAATCSPGYPRRAVRSVDINDRASISVGPFIWTTKSTDE